MPTVIVYGPATPPEQAAALCQLLGCTHVVEAFDPEQGEDMTPGALHFTRHDLGPQPELLILSLDAALQRVGLA